MSEDTQDEGRSKMYVVSLAKWVLCASGHSELMLMSLPCLRPDRDIYINGYKVFRADRPKRGGGVTLYMLKNTF